MEQDYFVTRDQVEDGLRFVHRGDCQVLPPEGALDRLGTFAECPPAMEAARGRHAPVDACALCCPDCHGN